MLYAFILLSFSFPLLPFSHHAQQHKVRNYIQMEQLGSGCFPDYNGQVQNGEFTRDKRQKASEVQQRKTEQRESFILSVFFLLPGKRQASKDRMKKHIIIIIIIGMQYQNKIMCVCVYYKLFLILIYPSIYKSHKHTHIIIFSTFLGVILPNATAQIDVEL